MIVDRVINNNIVSTIDDEGAELILMGRGLGLVRKVEMILMKAKWRKSLN